MMSRISITAPLRASPHRPAGAGSRRAAVTVRAGKGKGAKYRRGADDPYAKEKNKDKMEKQTKAKQSAEDGPLNSVFSKEEAKEEYSCSSVSSGSTGPGQPHPPPTPTPKRNPSTRESTPAPISAPCWA